MTPDFQGTLNAELAAIRALVEDHERRLFPVDRRGLPTPTGRVDRPHTGMVGDCWDIPGVGRARGWRVTCLDKGEEGGDCVYVHTPHSLYGDPKDPSGDTVALRPDDARRLAAAILSATDRVERRLAQSVVPLRAAGFSRPVCAVHPTEEV